MIESSAIPNCMHCAERGEQRQCVFHRQPTSSGFVVVAYCNACQATTTKPRPFFPKGRWASAALEAMPVLEARGTERCDVCGTYAVLETHHTAPREIFGAIECEHWPTARVCRTCHERWHRKMGQPIGDHRKRLTGDMSRVLTTAEVVASVVEQCET